ncbi:MAG: hypothetical protein FJZ43_03070 [Candidatus Staskawiczbacteria bacterium]|nr:hypothetical protein [Candidatus Staskawiczbacteria bacterium]
MGIGNGKYVNRWWVIVSPEESHVFSGLRREAEHQLMQADKQAILKGPYGSSDEANSKSHWIPTAQLS